MNKFIKLDQGEISSVGGGITFSSIGSNVGLVGGACVGALFGLLGVVGLSSFLEKCEMSPDYTILDDTYRESLWFVSVGFITASILYGSKIGGDVGKGLGVRIDQLFGVL